jgi:hypothetical protein
MLIACITGVLLWGTGASVEAGQTDWPLTYDGEGTFDQEQTDGSYGSCGC